MRDEYDAELIHRGVRGKYTDRYRADTRSAKSVVRSPEPEKQAESAMSLTELLPDIRALPRREKLRLIKVLAEELAEVEEETPFLPGATYPLWSPTDAYEGAATLLQVLKEKEGKP